MNNLTVTEFQNLRVLTTQQIAECYETSTDTITKNFNRNKERYIDGKHYICLEGEELKEFRAKGQIDLSPNANKFYLWTEKGTFLHAKSLNTDKAWEVYDTLVDTYFNAKEKEIETSNLSPELQMFNKLFQAMAINELTTKQAVETSKNALDRVESIREIVTLDMTSWRDEVNKILKKIGTTLGGGQQYGNVREESYKLFSHRMGYDLKIRLINRKKTMALEGSSRTNINNTSYLDIIASEKRMIECYVAIVKEMAIKYGVA